MARTLIIGGGMAGMAAAISAAAQGEQVTVLERNPKILKKLGVTGNGRGNLLNAGSPIYYGDTAFARAVLERMPYGRLAGFWEELGLALKADEEGRVYPSAFLASVAVEALRLRAEQLGITLCCHTRATRLFKDSDGFVVEAEETVMGAPTEKSKAGKSSKPVPVETIPRKYRGDRVIVTVGGAAAPAHGTDGMSYGLLTAFGHTLAQPQPALCALLTEKKPLAGLEGQRVRGELTLIGAKGEILHTAQGEALFAKDGVSGIAAMQLARFVTGNCKLHMDLRPAIGAEGQNGKQISQRLEALASARKGMPISTLLVGLMTGSLSRAVMSRAQITEFHRPMETLEKRDFARLSLAIVDFSLAVTGVRGFENAQVTAGGVDPAHFAPATMESRLCKGLYAAGEVLDVDGDCGGYNLMFALAGGLLAGESGGH